MTEDPDDHSEAAPNRNRTAEFIANPRRAVWMLSLPVMAGMGIQTLYTLTDMAFVGRLGGDAVAALTFNLPLAFFAIGIAFGLGKDGGERVIRTIGGPSCVAKNRYTLPEELPLSWPAFMTALTNPTPSEQPEN